MSGIPSTKANPIDRTYPPLFAINLPEEDQIVDDLEDIEGMQITIQAISFVVCSIVAIIILHQFLRDVSTCVQLSNIVSHSF